MEFPKSWVFAILRAILALSFRKILEFPLSFWKFLEFWLQKHYILAFLGEIWYINRIYLWYKAKRFPAFSGFLSFFEKNAWVFAKNFLSLSFWALEFFSWRLKENPGLCSNELHTIHTFHTYIDYFDFIVNSYFIWSSLRSSLSKQSHIGSKSCQLVTLVRKPIQESGI